MSSCRLFGGDVRQEAELAQVHAHKRHRSRGDGLGRFQQRAVAAHHDDEIRLGREFRPAHGFHGTRPAAVYGGVRPDLHLGIGQEVHEPGRHLSDLGVGLRPMRADGLEGYTHRVRTLACGYAPPTPVQHDGLSP